MSKDNELTLLIQSVGNNESPQPPAIVMVKEVDDHMRRVSIGELQLSLR